jgi:D-sedoheptulose 7-phosphate isomerase
MEKFIKKFINESVEILRKIPTLEIAKAINIIKATYERDGKIYIFGNGGSMALATHWVSDFNKTVFSHHLEKYSHRFQAIRVPSTEEELSAWANDVGYEMVFVGPLENYLKETDIVIAISSSGNSPNIIRAVKFAQERQAMVIGLSGFDGGKLNQLADIKILVPTKKGDYCLVEGIHDIILHLITQYFQDYFDDLQKS